MLSADALLRHVESRILEAGGGSRDGGLILVDPQDVTGVLKLDVEYPTGHRLAVFLAIEVSFGYPIWTQYSLQLQDDRDRTLFRYDNAPHHRALSSFPHHKHVRGRGDRLRVIAHRQPSLATMLHEVQEHIRQSHQPER